MFKNKRIRIESVLNLLLKCACKKKLCVQFPKQKNPNWIRIESDSVLCVWLEKKESELNPKWIRIYADNANRIRKEPEKNPNIKSDSFRILFRFCRLKSDSIRIHKQNRIQFGFNSDSLFLNYHAQYIIRFNSDSIRILLFSELHAPYFFTRTFQK